MNGQVPAVDPEGSPEQTRPAAKKKKSKAATSVAADKAELFDLASDPFETTNLAESQPEKVEELRKVLAAFAREALPPRAQAQPEKYVAPRVWGQSETAAGRP